MKNRTEILVGKLKLSEVLEKLWIYLTVNFITKLLLVAEKDAILVVYNRLSKMTYFVATIERTLAKGLARLFRDIWKSLRKLVKMEVSFSKEDILKRRVMSKLKIVDFILFLFYSHFYFFLFISYLKLRVRV